MTGSFRGRFRTMDDRSQPSIRELATRLRAGRLAAVALCEDCVGRIEQLNREINAVVALDLAAARAAAAASDERIAAGAARGRSRAYRAW